MKYELDHALLRLIDMQRDLTKATTGTTYKARIVIAQIIQVARNRNRGASQ